MAEATHTIASQGSDPEADPNSVGVTRSKAMMSAENSVHQIQIQPGILRDSRYTIYLFNVGTFAPLLENGNRAHIIMRPPLIPMIAIPACPAGEPYVKCCSFPELVSQFRTDPMTEQPVVHNDEAAHVAQDIINPQNQLAAGVSAKVVIENQWREVASPLHQGDDLGKFGVFFSLNETPAAEELARAKARVEKTYRAELTKAEMQARAGKLGDISELAHFAADHFRVQAGWHVAVTVPDDCPNCGEPIKKGIAYHVNSFGATCVIDWRKAVAAGIKTKADVPEELRWFKEKSSTGAVV
jgi:hypothetical protein